MTPKLSSEKRSELEDIIIDSFVNLTDDYSGVYHDLNQIKKEDKSILIESQYLFNEAYKDGPNNRGMFINKHKTFLVWVNEEDHIKVISTRQGSNVKQTYKCLINGIEKMEKTINFVQHENLGFFRYCIKSIYSG